MSAEPQEILQFPKWNQGLDQQDLNNCNPFHSYMVLPWFLSEKKKQSFFSVSLLILKSGEMPKFHPFLSNSSVVQQYYILAMQSLCLR